MGKLMNMLNIKTSVGVEDNDEDIDKLVDGELEQVEGEAEDQNDAGETEGETEAEGEDGGEEAEGEAEGSDNESEGEGSAEGDESDKEESEAEGESDADDAEAAKAEEEEKEPTEGEIFESASDDKTKLDEVSRQLLELNSEQAELEAEQEEIEDVTESLESIRADLVGSLESGGLTPLAAKFAQQNIQLHLSRVGSTIPTISNEAFGLSGTRIGNTQVIVSGLESRIDDMISKGKEVLNGIVKFIKDAYNKLMGNYASIVTDTKALLAKLPEDLDSKIKVSGSKVSSVSSNGKVVSNVSNALAAQFDFADTLMNDNTTISWVMNYFKDSKDLSKLRIPNMPAYLKNTSTSNAYSAFADGQYTIKTATAPLGNFEAYGAVSTLDEDVTAENALMFAKQRFGTTKLDSESEEVEADLGSVADIRKALEAAIKYFEGGEASKVSYPELDINESGKDEAGFALRLKCRMAVGKSYMQPQSQAMVITASVAKDYLTVVKGAIKATVKEAAPEATA